MNPTLKEYTDSEIEEFIDETSEPVRIGSLTYSAGYALRILDEVAFNCVGSEMPDVWICSECEKEHDDEDDAAECCAPDDTDTTDARASE